MIRKTIAVLLVLSLFSLGSLTSCGAKTTESPSGSVSISSNSPASSDSSKDSSSFASSSGSIASANSSSNSISASSQSSASSASGSKSSSSKSSQVSSTTSTGTPTPTVTTAPKATYFVCGSWDGYQVNEPADKMQLVSGSSTFYTFTVTLTNALRKDYGGVEGPGHWYKITEGSWSLPSYGTDFYVQQPAPVEKTPAGVAIGLGSIWINQDLTLTILFDSAAKIVYDNANGKVLPAP